ncbi:MAG: hypothetical protein J5I81_05490 [Nitrococcus mobilis]|nr:hypothetical protein [Nitrococcus mobilis]
MKLSRARAMLDRLLAEQGRDQHRRVLGEGPIGAMGAAAGAGAVPGALRAVGRLEAGMA